MKSESDLRHNNSDNGNMHEDYKKMPAAAACVSQHVASPVHKILQQRQQQSNTVFGVCIVQIKPQLEKLLNIPRGGLIKEVQLTEDLIELFAKYLPQGI